MPTHVQPLRVGDVSRWHRPAAKTLQDRTLTGGGDSGVSLGHSYSTCAWRPEAQGSWAFQLKQVTRQLSVHPLGVYDRGYGKARFVNQTAAIEAALRLRLASNRCVYGAPPP